MLGLRKSAAWLPQRVLPWLAGGPLSPGEGSAFPPAEEDGCCTLWARLDSMTRIEAYYDDEDVLKETLNGEEDLKWLEKTFVETRGEQPMLEEDVKVRRGRQMGRRGGSGWE